MTELEDLKKQERECKIGMSNLLYYGSVCRAKFDELHKKYQTIKDKLAVLEVEEMVNKE